MRISHGMIGLVACLAVATVEAGGPAPKDNNGQCDATSIVVCYMDSHTRAAKTFEADIFIHGEGFVRTGDSPCASEGRERCAECLGELQSQGESIVAQSGGPFVSGEDEGDDYHSTWYTLTGKIRCQLEYDDYVTLI